jgi:hypothetical protein
MNGQSSDRVRELTLALANARERGRDRDRAYAHAWVHAFTRYFHSTTPRTLVILTVQLLPAAQRSRYREEFLVEMFDLSKLERWGYALRVLTNSWQLRRALVRAGYNLSNAPARQAKR